MKTWPALALILASGAALPGLADAAPQLERVVIVARHGVRAPTKPPSALNVYAAQRWPEWPVGPGELTPHGAVAAREMGAWLRAHYAAAGLLPAAGCPSAGEVFVWADGKDHRTVQSGDAVLQGLAPGCGLRAAHVPDGSPDPVFSAVEAGKCPVGKAEEDAIAARVQQKLAALPADYTPALDALRNVLDPADQRKPCGDAAGRCFEDGQNRLATGAEGTKVKGPLATGASLAEDLSLQYAENLPTAAPAWQSVDLPALTRIMVLHNVYSAMTRRDPGLAAHNGAYLAAAVLAGLQARPVQPGEKPARLTLLLGHDTNLDNLAGIFGLDWKFSDQPDNTPPDGELVFELLKDGADETVRILARAQSAPQLRKAGPLTAADAPQEIPLSPAYCAPGSCAVSALQAQVQRLVPAACMPHG